MDVNGILSWLQDFAVLLWAQWQVQFLVGHIALNVVVAIAATIASGEFVLGKTPEFLWKKVLPLVAVYAVFQVFASGLQMDGLDIVIWGVLELLLVNDTLDNLKKLGIKFLPEWATKERLEPN